MVGQVTAYPRVALKKREESSSNLKFYRCTAMTEKEEAPLNEVNNIDFSENYARLSKEWTGLVTFACGPLTMGSDSPGNVLPWE